MKLDDIYPSKWLKASDIGDDPRVLTIDRIELTELQDGTRKPAVYFQEEEKGLILNKTNANTIAATYGDDTDDWQGHRIQLVSVPVDMQGKTVDAIRVRARPQKQSQPKPQPGYGEAKARVTSGQQPAMAKAETLDDEIPW